MDAPTSTGINAAARVWGRAAESHTLNVDVFKKIIGYTVENGLLKIQNEREP